VCLVFEDVFAVRGMTYHSIGLSSWLINKKGKDAFGYATQIPELKDHHVIDMNNDNGADQHERVVKKMSLSLSLRELGGNLFRSPASEFCRLKIPPAACRVRGTSKSCHPSITVLLPPFHQ